MQMTVTATTPALVPYSRFLAEVGIDPSTGWRWRKQGMIETTNIYGRLYIAPEEISRFNSRAKAGEFAKEHKVPKRIATK